MRADSSIRKSAPEEELRARRLVGVVVLLVIGSALSHAQREPVLKQIDVPHPYYFREMYLPQLTTGPSAAAWSPDSRAVVYSMSGSLWVQSIEATPRRN